MESDDLSLRIYIQEEFSARIRSWFHWLYERLALRPGDAVLELGCGPGTLWLWNAEHLPSGCSIILTDLALDMLVSAQAALSGLPRCYHLCTADTLDLPFPDEHFDLVLANGLLDLVPEPSRALAEIERVLKPGGRFAAATGARGHLQQLEELAAEVLPSAQFGRGSDRFTLENGPGQVEKVFQRVQSETFQSELQFNKPDPLIIYARSEISAGSQATSQALARFRQVLEEKLEKDGELRVAVRKGLIRAVKGG